MIYTLDELREKIKPIAEKYEIPAVYIFGSYARGEATEDSDVDVLYNGRGSKVQGLIWGELYEDLRENLRKGLDLVEENCLLEHESVRETPWLVDNIIREKVRVYG